MKTRILWLAAWLGCLFAAAGRAGEIIIIQDAADKPRGQQAAQQAKDKARQQAGKPVAGTTIVITDQPIDRRGPTDAEETGRDAREYLRPPPAMEPAMDGSTTIILRAAPTSDAEKARLRARSYVPAAGARAKECGTAASQIGTIGEGPGAEQSGSVVERGTSSVNVQCK